MRRRLNPEDNPAGKHVDFSWRCSLMTPWKYGFVLVWKYAGGRRYEYVPWKGGSGGWYRFRSTGKADG